MSIGPVGDSSVMERTVLTSVGDKFARAQSGYSGAVCCAMNWESNNFVLAICKPELIGWLVFWMDC